MLPAELNGKVSATQPPNERMEDVLTSHVFSLFRYMTVLRIPLAFLGKAENLHGELLALGNVRMVRSFFWPKYRLGNSPRLREFDVLLFLDSDNEGSVAIGVENKYRSGPSNTAPDPEVQTEEDTDVPAFTGNQLADEYQGLHQLQRIPQACGQELAVAQRRLLLYVTKDFVLPRQQLAEALQSLRKRAIAGASHDLESTFYWLSWHVLHNLLIEERRAGFPGHAPGEQRLLEDVLHVLNRRDLLEFRPFEEIEELRPYETLFPGGVIPY
jgi:hypothetical protein